MAKTKKQAKDFKAGSEILFSGRTFIVLGEEQNGVLLIAKDGLMYKRQFDADGNNNWRESGLRAYLNNGKFFMEEAFAPNELLPFKVDLTADDGDKSYGSSTDKVFVLTTELYRKYFAVIPETPSWIWTSTALACREESNEFLKVRCFDKTFSDLSTRAECTVMIACLIDRDRWCETPDV